MVFPVLALWPVGVEEISLDALFVRPSHTLGRPLGLASAKVAEGHELDYSAATFGGGSVAPEALISAISAAV